jgi:hypothetical protein
LKECDTYIAEANANAEKQRERAAVINDDDDDDDIDQGIKEGVTVAYRMKVHTAARDRLRGLGATKEEINQAAAIVLHGRIWPDGLTPAEQLEVCKQLQDNAVSLLDQVRSKEA